MFINKTSLGDRVTFLSYMLKIQRIKRTKKVIGCGFPHFLHRFMQIANMCEYFIIPDESYQSMYAKQVKLKPICEILKEDLTNLFVICFSYNNYALLKRLIEKGFIKDNVEYIEVDDFLETNKEKFSVLTSEDRLLEAPNIEIIGNDFNKFRMRNAMKVAGRNQIYLLSNATFYFSYISMNDSQIHLYNKTDLTLNNVYMRRNSRINVYENASISTGSLYLCDHVDINVYNGCAEFGHAYIGSYTKIMVFDHLYIGDDCLISWNVSIMDGDAHMLKIGSDVNRPQAIIIHDHVWIGSNVTILKGVEIGEGCLIGSGSVVTKSLPAHSLAVGCPAKVIKGNVEWESDYIL